MTSARPHLDALARLAGILPEYANALDGRPRSTSPDTAMALLAAMGHDASSEDAARRTLADLEQRRAGHLLDAVQVFQTGSADSGGPALEVRLPAGEGPFEWRVDLSREDGQAWTAEGRAAGDEPGLRIRLCELPPGYHEVELRVRGSRRDQQARQLLAAAPQRCVQPAEVLPSGRGMGLCVNLYALRSARNWGVGDFGDLARLCRWSAGLGADFCGLNPLHALHNCGLDISPYSPVSRLYRNPLYLELPAVPEFAECAEARELVSSGAGADALDALRPAAELDYEQVMAFKGRIAHLLHRVFAARHRGQSRRGEEYARYLRREGRPLIEFATFMALRDHFGGAQACDWRNWPDAYHRPGSAAVEEFCRHHPEEVDYHCYIQFELDRQLASAAGAARDAGMGVGLYQDLAIGSAPSGSDAWGWPDLFVSGVTVGAPPDEYARGGQDWGFCPVHPRRLRDTRYDYWIRLLRAAFQHSGALRIDHVMGLLRQFWIPAGVPAANGAYVSYPADDLFGLLTLESSRHHSLVIGEDLGTVPDRFAERLEARGILSCKVMYFERQHDGAYRSASDYPARALVTVNTHDHVPLAGFWKGRELQMQRQLGLLASDQDLSAAFDRRLRDRAQLLERLVAEGLWDAERGKPASHAELCAALHAFLRRTPCALIGLMLDDLTGETDPINIPGVGPQQHRSWTRRNRLSLEEICADPGIQRAVRAACPEGGSE